jgi:hypothetical protein
MKSNKKVLDALILILILMSIIVPITIIEGLKYNALPNPTLELNRGFQVSYDEIPQSEPIVILNPKECNIFYRSRINQDYIVLNYITLPGVTVEEYVLDGAAPHTIPRDNTIQTPVLGNHTLMLTGKNSTGSSCSSEIVNFYICSDVPGVCGAAPDWYYYTYESTVHPILLGHNHGLVTDTPFDQEIFLEGPQISFTSTSYTKKVDLNYEGIGFYVPFIILRSEPWYNHTIEIIDSHWVNLVGDGKSVGRIWMTSGITYSARYGNTVVIYFLVDLLHVFGKVIYWNGETRYYDVFTVEFIGYDNTYSVSYGANESILEYPLLGHIDFSQFSGTYHDKNMTENSSWGWQKDEDWIKSYGIEANVFLGNYAGVDSCPVPVRFSLPQPHIQNNELIPDEIIHPFKRTDSQPDTFGVNYRGLENTFSLNILPI